MSMLATRTHEPGLRIKPLVGYGLALAILLAVGIFQYKIIGALVESDIWIIHAHEVLAELEGGCSGLQQAEWGSRSYAATAFRIMSSSSARELGVQTNIFAPLELSPPAIPANNRISIA